jgi:hypothetical protein
MHKPISSILILGLMNLMGCYSLESVTVPEYKQVEEEKGKPDEIFVLTKDLEKYHFSNSNFYVETDTLYGKGEIILDDSGRPFEGAIALSDIVSIKIESFDLANTCLWSGGIYVGVAAIALVLAIIIANP